MKKIIVCIKQVPDVSEITVNPKNFTLDRGNAESILNPLDLYALNAAKKIKKHTGYEIVAISMGPENAKNVLYEALAIGADSAYLINDRAFAASDTWATSYILSRSIEYIGDFFCILCGKQAIDGDTAQVPPSISAHLKIPIIPYVKTIVINNNEILMESIIEDSNISYRPVSPFVATIIKEFGEPNLPSLRDWDRAFKINIPIISNKELSLQMDMIGLNGSPTKVSKIKAISFNKETSYITGTYKEQTQRLLSLISPESKTDGKVTAQKLYNTSKNTNKLIIIGEFIDSMPASTINELSSIGKKLAYQSDSRLILCALGNKFDLEGLDYFDEIHTINTTKKGIYDFLSLADSVIQVIKELSPIIILGGATMIGRIILPIISTSLNTGLTADCTELSFRDGLLYQTRPALGGNILATIICDKHLPQMATVRPNVFDKISIMLEQKKSIYKHDASFKDSIVAKTSKTSLNSSDKLSNNIVFSGGLGLGKDGFSMLSSIKDELGFSIGASRSAVDAGWIDYSHQIGQSGRTIQADIYVAFGISGAVQHLVGMKSSSTIIAINNDKDAPIFEVADFGIIGDCRIIIKELIRILKYDRI